VRRLADRRRGLGADGVLRVVPSALHPEAASQAAEAPWFMDHWNADGSTAEMCGNGIRLFGRYLVAAGLCPPGRLRVLTRSGVKDLDVEAGDGDVTVDMGPAEVGGQVDVDGVGAQFVSMGNPHAVLPVPSVAALGELPPRPARPQRRVRRGRRATHVRMRVHERGVGETRSCGTGACAVGRRRRRCAPARRAARRTTSTCRAVACASRGSRTGRVLMTGRRLVAEGVLTRSCCMSLTPAQPPPR
jgi:diaminopimelate epimerase